MAATQFRVLVTHNQVHPVVMARMAGIGARVDLMEGPITEEVLVRELQRAADSRHFDARQSAVNEQGH